MIHTPRVVLAVIHTIREPSEKQASQNEDDNRGGQAGLSPRFVPGDKEVFFIYRRLQCGLRKFPNLHEVDQSDQIDQETNPEQEFVGADRSPWKTSDRCYEVDMEPRKLRLLYRQKNIREVFARLLGKLAKRSSGVCFVGCGLFVGIAPP